VDTEKAGRSSKSGRFEWNFPAMPDAGKWADVCRQQYELALDLADAVLVGAERLQQAQLEAARDIQAQNRKSADALAGVADPRALMTAQAALASTRWQAAMRQWSGMGEIVQKTNADCVRILELRCMQLGENWKSAASAPQCAAGGIPDAWKSVMETALKSSESMMRALTAQPNGLQATMQSEGKKAKAT